MGLLDRIWPTKKIAITEQAPTHSDKAKALAQLQESFQNQPDLFSSMFDRFYANGTWFLPITGVPMLGGTSNKTQGADRYNFYTEQDLRFQRDAARMLFGREPTAKGIEGHLNAFVVGSGFTYRIMPKKEYEETFNLETLAEYQQALDDWMIEQAWPQREQECYTCQVVDGEWFLWVTVNDGKVQIRRIEPEHIQNKPGASFKDGWYLGVKVDLKDVETPLAYGYKPDYVEWREIPAAEIVHLKDNVTRNVARGISSFWPVIDDLNNVANLLDNLVAGSAARAEIPYMWSIKNATPQAINSFADQRADRSVQNPLTNKTDLSKGQKSARAVAHGDNVEFTTMPAGDSDAYIASLQAALRAIGNRWCFPEFFSGDASNGNYASSLVAGGPFVRFVEKVQNNIKPPYKRVMNIVLDNFVATGIIAVNDREKLDIEIGCDSPIIHDELADAQAKDILRRNGVLSPQEWVAADGRDWEDVQRNLDEWNERNMQTPDLGQSAGTAAFGAQQADKDREASQDKPVKEMIDASGHAHVGKGSPEGGQFTSKRFDKGGKLSPDDKKKVLKTVSDVYKDAGLLKSEIKGYNRDDEPIYGYPHSPDLFIKSDVTGAKVRHYLTLPDGTKAHPSELYPEITQAEIDRSMAEVMAKEKEKESDEKSKIERVSATKADANMKYKSTNRPMLHSYFSSNDKGEWVRVDGTDLDEQAFYLSKGYTKSSQAVVPTHPVNDDPNLTSEIKATRRRVEELLKDGKTVPEEVMVFYPDLQAKYNRS